MCKSLKLWFHEGEHIVQISEPAQIKNATNNDGVNSDQEDSNGIF